MMMIMMMIMITMIMMMINDDNDNNNDDDGDDDNDDDGDGSSIYEGEPVSEWLDDTTDSANPITSSLPSSVANTEVVTPSSVLKLIAVFNKNTTNIKSPIIINARKHSNIDMSSDGTTSENKKNNNNNGSNSADVFDGRMDSQTDRIIDDDTTESSSSVHDADTASTYIPVSIIIVDGTTDFVDDIYTDSTASIITIIDGTFASDKDLSDQFDAGVDVDNHALIEDDCHTASTSTATSMFSSRESIDDVTTSIDVRPMECIPDDDATAEKDPSFDDVCIDDHVDIVEVEDHRDIVDEDDHGDNVKEDHCDTVKEDHRDSVGEDHRDNVEEDHRDSVEEDHRDNDEEDHHRDNVEEDHRDIVEKDDHRDIFEEDHGDSVEEDHSDNVNEVHRDNVEEDDHRYSVEEDHHRNSVEEDDHRDCVEEYYHRNSIDEDDHRDSVEEDHNQSLSLDVQSVTISKETRNEEHGVVNITSDTMKLFVVSSSKRSTKSRTTRESSRTMTVISSSLSASSSVSPSDLNSPAKTVTSCIPDYVHDDEHSIATHDDDHYGLEELTSADMMHADVVSSGPITEYDLNHRSDESEVDVSKSSCLDDVVEASASSSKHHHHCNDDGDAIDHGVLISSIICESNVLVDHHGDATDDSTDYVHLQDHDDHHHLHQSQIPQFYHNMNHHYTNLDNRRDNDSSNKVKRSSAVSSNSFIRSLLWISCSMVIMCIVTWTYHSTIISSTSSSLSSWSLPSLPISSSHLSSSIKQQRYYDSDLTIFTHEMNDNGDDYDYAYGDDDVDIFDDVKDTNDDNDVNVDNDDKDVGCNGGGDDDHDDDDTNADDNCEIEISSDDNSNYSLFNHNDRSDKAIQRDTKKGHLEINDESEQPITTTTTTTNSSQATVVTTINESIFNNIPLSSSAIIVEPNGKSSSSRGKIFAFFSTVTDRMRRSLRRLFRRNGRGGLKKKITADEAIIHVRINDRIVVA